MVHVNSEIGRLRQLLIHQPDEGIARITPKRAEELLFDDIVFYPKIKAEHKVYTDLLDIFIGKGNVLEVHDLLKEALDNADVSRMEILQMIIQYEELPFDYVEKLAALSNEVLAEVLITGELKSEKTIICDPIPNFIFTRDIAVVVNDHVIITKAGKEARYRENLLTRFIFWEHPMFNFLQEKDRIINLNLPDLFPPSRQGESVSIEGGDMMILNQDYLLIGSSERSTQHAFESIKKVLFEKEVIDNVVNIQIPKERSFMHIDTLFTQIDHDCMVGYKPILHDGAGSIVSVHNKSGEKRIYPTLEHFIRAEVNADMKFVYAADGLTPHQEREQWTDACNMLALRPGIAIAYDRNVHTALAFEKAGYKVMEAAEFIKSAKNDSNLVETAEKVIFTLPSGELSRARGGSHCMSCPLLRDKL